MAVRRARLSLHRLGASHLYSTETGEQRLLTNPPIEEIGDTSPAVSPYGRTLVCSRVSPDFDNVTLWLLHLGEGYKPLGKEEKVQTGNVTNIGAAWLPDGSEFVFSSGTGTNFGLWLSAVSSGAIPKKVLRGLTFHEQVQELWLHSLRQ